MLLAVLWSSPSAAQVPRDRPKPVPSATGRIVGRVVSAGPEPKPLRRALVTLNGSALRPGRTAITQDDGAFAFDALPPGQYSIAVVKSGYVSLAYGATGPGRPGVPITVVPGGQQTLAITVPRGGVITGLVTDGTGQPLPGLQVRALMYRILRPAGDRQLVEVEVPGTTVVSDDRGVYRIFGLPSGEYAVAVRPAADAEAFLAGLRTVTAAEVGQALAEVRQSRDRRTPGLPSARPPRSVNAADPGVRVAFAPVFYPGTARASQARLVTVGAGEERTAIDVEIEYVPVARIAGTVIGPAGGSTPAYVRLVPDPQEALAGQAGFRGITTNADGTFAFDHVPPGRYIVAARASSDGSMALRYDAGTALWASTEVVVDGQDIPNLVLSPVPGVTLEGRLVFQGERPPPRLSQLRGLGLPLTSRTVPGSPMALVAADGRFTVYGMPPGTYWPDYSAGIRNPIGAWWLKSIAIDGREMLDAPLELRSSTSGATVTFGDTASALGGRVVFATGEPATNCTVVVFPVERTAWFFNSRRIAAAPLDAQGRYVVRNLPAGDYLIVARADLDQLEWFNPLTLDKLAASAAKLAIRNDEILTFDITIR
jgi:Carboxypeptidase regulatory-like domain